MPVETSAAPSTPAAAPVTSTPAAPSSGSPSPGTSTTSTPSTPTTPASTSGGSTAPSGPPNRNDFKDSVSYIEASLAYNRSQTEAAEKGESQPAPESDPVANGELDLAKATEEAGKDPATDPVKPEETPEQKAIREEAEKAAKPADGQQEDEFKIEIDDELGAKEFDDALKADPKLSEAIEAHPELKAAIFKNARMASELAPYKEMFPTIEVAKAAQANAAVFSELDNRFLDIAPDGEISKEGVAAFMDKWAEQARIVNEDGTPALDANGKQQLHPAFQGLIRTIANDSIEHMLKNPQQNMDFLDKVGTVALNVMHAKAVKENDEDMILALETIKARGNPSTVDPNNQELPDHVKAAAEKNKADREELDRREQERRSKDIAAAKKASDDSTARAEARFNSQLNKQMESLLADPKYSLSKFAQGAAVDAAIKLCNEKLDSNSLFWSQRDQILALPPGADREKALVQHYMSHTQQVIGPIMKKVLNDAREGVIDRQTATQAKREEQKAASKTDPKGASLGAPPSQPLSPKDLSAKIRKDFADTHGGRQPSTQEFIVASLDYEQKRLMAGGV